MRRMLRMLIVVALAASTLAGVTAGPSSASAASQTAGVVLTDPPQSDGLTALPGWDSTTSVSDAATTRDGRACWNIGSSSANYAVYAKLDAAFKHSGPNYATISVDYYDEAPMKFAFVYDATSNPFRNARTVTMTGTRTWQTASVFVTDALFQNRESGWDMRISRYDGSFGLADGPLCIGAIRVTPSPIATQDVQVGVTQSGNVFSPGQRPAFQVRAVTGQVGWTVSDHTGRQVAAGDVALDPSSRQADISAPAQPPGYYTLAVTAHDGPAVLKTRTTGFAVLPPGPDLTKVKDSVFGINTHASRLSAEQVEQSDELARLAGIKDDRDDDSYWNVIETQPGSYTFDAANDNVVDTMVATGKKPLLLLGFGNGLYDGGGTPYTDAGYEAFGKYAAAVAKHYAGRISGLEVWNEYYGGFSNGPCAQSPDCYYKLLKSAYTHVKAVEPQMTIVGASAFKAPLDWFGRLFEDGGLRYMDALSIHPYRSPGLPEGLELDVAGLQKLVKQYSHGPSTPIWITEQGWVSQPGPPVGVSEQTQADYAVRSVILAQSAGVAEYYWYDLLNDGTDPADGEQNFGLMRIAGLDADGITAKPAYVAYATAARMLTGATFAARESAGDDSVYAMRYQAQGGPLKVLWTASDTPKAVAVRASGPVTLTDVMGASRTLKPVDGTILLTLTGDPVYLSGPVGTVRAAAGLSVSGPASDVHAGSPVPLTLTLDNRAGLTSAPSVTASFSIDGRDYKVTAGRGTVGTTTVTMPAQKAAGARDYVASVALDGIPAGYAVGRVTIGADRATASVAPELTGSGSASKEQLSVSVSNTDTRHALTATSVDWSYGGQSGTVTAGLTVPPSSSRTVRIPVDKVPYYQINTASVKVHLDDGSTAAAKDSFGFSPVTRATPRMVDGSLVGLDSVPAIDLAEVGSYTGVSAKDLSGTMWTAWDRKNLYVAARVKEATYTVQPDPLWLQAGDSVGIGLEPGKAGKGLGTWGAAWYDLYAGQTTGAGPQVFDESLPITRPAGLMPGAKVQVARDDAAQTTTYLIALPWSQLAPLSPDSRSFSMTLDLNRNDQSGKPGWRGAGLAGWQQWGDGLNNFSLASYQTVLLTG